MRLLSRFAMQRLLIGRRQQHQSIHRWSSSFEVSSSEEEIVALEQDGGEVPRGGEEGVDRLSKLVARSGLASRRESEAWILDGRISVNGQVVRFPGARANPVSDRILVDGIALERNQAAQGKGLTSKERPRLWAVHKYAQELVADRDPEKKRRLMLERVRDIVAVSGSKNKDSGSNSSSSSILKPISRLEFNTEGLCLVSDNGELARLLASESLGLERKFRVRVHGSITESKLEGLRRGLFVEGVKYKPMTCHVDRTGKGTISWMSITITEARTRVIQKSFQALFLKPLRIISVGFGPYSLGDLKEGQWQELKLTPQLLSQWRQRHNYR